MIKYPIFLSVVLVVRNHAKDLAAMLAEISRVVSSLASDYELIVVDNASEDNTVEVLKQLTEINGLPNLQVFALIKEVDSDSAVWAGVENALGDFVGVFNPECDDVHYLPAMVDRAVSGCDVVFASNTQKSKQGLVYRACLFAFDAIYKWLNGIRPASEASQYRLLSKRVINFIFQHPLPNVAYRYLPATVGFARANLTYSTAPKDLKKKSIAESVVRGMRLLLSTTRAPMRLVTLLCLFGAFSNLVYSAYVVAIAIFKDDVAAGWVTLSLQQSGMFFLMSLVLLVLSEYILQMVRLSNEGPPYHIGQEFTSAVMTRREKLNVEESNFVEPNSFVEINKSPHTR